MTPSDINEQKNALYSEKLTLESRLNSDDYKTIKNAEAHAAGLKMLAWNVWDKGECGAIAAQAAYIPIRHEWIFVFGREVGELNATVLKKTAGKKQSAFSGQRQRDGTIKKHLRK